MKILSANYVLPISSEPIVRGGVTIEGSGIIAVGSLADLARQFPEAPVEDFGEAAILPGFVNCHSHLEITAMRGALDQFENNFYKWLITLTKLRGEVLSEDDIKVAAIGGAIEGARSGVTCFGDIGRFGIAGFEALHSIGLRGVLYQETEFSADGATADVDFEKLKEKFRSLASGATDLVEVGISPHAAYTVSRELFERIAELAVDENIKITIHAAESKDEDELLRKGSGFFTSVYEKFDVDWKSPRCSSVEFLAQTGILRSRPLLAHCITVSERDIEIIKENGAAVAHCPKSNAKFGHGYAPFEKLLDSGISVGLGSDSVASNNMCDMLDEARHAAFAARNRVGSNKFITEKDVLFSATLGGATALGLDERIGSLEAGKQADITVIKLDQIAQQPVANVEAALVFSSNSRDVAMTMVAGREVYKNDVCLSGDEERVRSRLGEIGGKLRQFLAS